MASASKSGRPSGYSKALCERARKVALLGATDAEIADILEINIATLHRWKAQFPEFCDALKAGKAPADDRVERSLFQKACGYTFDTVKIVADAKTGAVVRVPHREHVPPDTTAAIFWLKNRRKEEWRDKQEVEHSGAIDVTSSAEDGKRKLAALIASEDETGVAREPDA